MLKIRNSLYLLTIIFFIIFIYLSNNFNTRCSSIGAKIFDDIFGLDIAHKKCLENKDYKLKKIISIKSIDNNIDNNEDPMEENILNIVERPEDQRFHDIEMKQEKQCPNNSDVILVIGQSNSANELLNDKEYPNEINLNYFKEKCYVLKDPVLGATGHKNSIIPALSSKLKSKKPIIFLTNGWNGTCISEWSKPESELTKYTRDNLINIIKNNKLKYIIWIQGECDWGTNINYVDHFLKFKTNLLKNIYSKQEEKATFIVTQTSICGNQRTDEKITTQQKSLSKYNDIIVTDGTDNLNDNYRHDRCHLNKFGIEKITDEISQIINSSY